MSQLNYVEMGKNSRFYDPNSEEEISDIQWFLRSKGGKKIIFRAFWCLKIFPEKLIFSKKIFDFFFLKNEPYGIYSPFPHPIPLPYTYPLIFSREDLY